MTMMILLMLKKLMFDHYTRGKDSKDNSKRELSITRKTFNIVMKVLMIKMMMTYKDERLR